MAVYRPIGHWIAVVVVIFVASATMLANHMTMLNPNLLALGLFVVVAGCLYLIFERWFSASN
jgi:hypothetical protein